MELSRSAATILRLLSGDLGVEDLSLDPKATIAAMDERYSFSSTRMAIAALKKGYPACKEFTEESAKRRLEFKKLDESQVATERQVETYVAWPDLLAWRDANWDSLNQLEQLLLALYTYWEPARVDYTPMKIVKGKPKVLEDGMNYMVIKKTSIDVIFHAFKTHKTIGDVTRKAPKPLDKLLRAWVETHPGQEYLLQDDEGKPWQTQRLGTAVRRIFQTYHSLDTGISMLRHSYSTHLNRGQKSLAELNKTSGRMMHSVITNQAYRFLNLE
jgi:hypothetical protein